MKNPFEHFFKVHRSRKEARAKRKVRIPDSVPAFGSHSHRSAFEGRTAHSRSNYNWSESLKRFNESEEQRKLRRELAERFTKHEISPEEYLHLLNETRRLDDER